MGQKEQEGELVSNRRAGYDYEILDKYEAGMVLSGTEIKSLRNHGGSLQDSYVVIDGGEVFLKNASIAPYKFGNVFNHAERRDRKLLLHRGEIDKIKRTTERKGLTIIPLAIYLKRGRAKVRIATARGKRRYDKREAIKRREQQRTVARMLKR
ncbi:MAG: SsrA-binding protein SmpB [Simkaniaceae bacterium]|nr:SsrA-binding protein SmpB [Simkaniaceae bacterium]